MATPKITALEFQDRIRTGILARNSAYDTAYGPIPDVVINPVAAVLEEQNDRIRSVSLLLSLVNSATFNDADVEAYVANEGLVRSPGAAAVTDVTFSRTAPPTQNLQVARGYPIGTSADEASGASITFVTTETRTLVLGTGFNLATRKYELVVPVIALTAGSAGLVGAGRINRALRPLVDFEAVTNTAPTVGARDRESNAELIARYMLAILGTQYSTPVGIERRVRTVFRAVEDVAVVGGINAALVRAASDAGAVDVYVVGKQAVSLTQSLTYLGVGQIIAVPYAPLLSVEGVTGYIEGVDYEVVFDTSGVSGSVRAVEGVRFLSTATTALPAAGASVVVAYTYNDLVRLVQDDLLDPEAQALGSDTLVRQGTEVDIYLEATLTVLTGFNATGSTGVSTFVQAALLAYVGVPDVPGGLALGAPVQGSDLQAVVRAISGVDNFVITRLVRGAADVGTADLTLGSAEYARLPTANLRITVA